MRGEGLAVLVGAPPSEEEEAELLLLLLLLLAEAGMLEEFAESSTVKEEVRAGEGSCKP